MTTQLCWRTLKPPLNWAFRRRLSRYARTPGVYINTPGGRSLAAATPRDRIRIQICHSREAEAAQLWVSSTPTAATSDGGI